MKAISPPQFDILNMQSPYIFYQWAREHQPIFFDYKSKYWVISRYRDVKDILRNEQDFSAELERVNYATLCPYAREVLDPINFVELYGLSTTENPDHDRVKRVVMPIFNELFFKKLRPKITTIIESYIDSITEGVDIDIIKHMLNNLPAEIIFTILGISHENINKVKEWSHSRLALTWGTKNQQVEHAEKIVKYWNFTKELITWKLESPGYDLPSLLLPHYKEGTLKLHDIHLLCYGLIFSGHTTTSTFMAEALKTLIETGTWKEIIASQIKFHTTADELLRLCPSAFTRRRLALKDINISGMEIKRGSHIILAIGSANRDEEVFEDPNEVILGRTNANRHLTFGSGFHYCIGAKLVRLEYALIMDKLAQRFPNLSLSPNHELKYDNNISIRALKQLWVRT